MAERPKSRDLPVFAAWAALVRRRWPVGATIFLLIVGLAAAVVLLARPVYRAEARLRLGEPPPMGGVSPSGGLLSIIRPGGDPFANDLELLASRSVAEQVVEATALNVTLDAPRGWHRDSLFVRLSATRETEAAAFEVEWRGDGAIHVARTAPEDSTIGSTAAGSPITFGGVEAVFRPWREGMPRRIALRTRPFGEAVRRLRSAVEIERARREANVLDLAYQDTDPALTRAVVDRVVERFLALRSEVQRRESGQTVDSLRTVRDRTARELAAAEESLEAFQRGSRLVAPEVQGELLVERYAELSAELETARIERLLVGDDEWVAVVVGAAGTADTAGAAGSALAAPGLLESEAVSRLVDQLGRLQAQRAELTSRLAESSRAVQVLDEQVREVAASLNAMVATYRRELDETIGRLETELAEVGARIERLPSDFVAYAQHRRSVEILSQVLVLTEQRLRQEELRQALTYANVQVIDPPALRYRPVWPRKKLGVAVGMLLGGIFGLLGMVVVERADRRVRSGAVLRRVIDAPVLAAFVRRTAIAGSAPDAAPDSATALAVTRAASSAPDASMFVLASVDDDTLAAAVADVLGNALDAEFRSRAGAAPAPSLRAAPRIDAYPAAAHAAAHGAPVVLVVEYGRTSLDALARAAALLEDAGGRVAGAIVVCRDEREVAAVWA